jgi:hypothetical protein
MGAGRKFAAASISASDGRRNPTQRSGSAAPSEVRARSPIRNRSAGVGPSRVSSGAARVNHRILVAESLAGQSTCRRLISAKVTLWPPGKVTIASPVPSPLVSVTTTPPMVMPQTSSRSGVRPSPRSVRLRLSRVSAPTPPLRVSSPEPPITAPSPDRPSRELPAVVALAPIVSSPNVPETGWISENVTLRAPSVTCQGRTRAKDRLGLCGTGDGIAQGRPSPQPGRGAGSRRCRGAGAGGDGGRDDRGAGSAQPRRGAGRGRPLRLRACLRRWIPTALAL